MNEVALELRAINEQAAASRRLDEVEEMHFSLFKSFVLQTEAQPRGEKVKSNSRI